MGRILIFTGKGGVGKTSMAAAHARASALEGKRTLLVSTDMAHNLSDIFGMPIGREEREAAPNLYSMEIDPTYVMEHEFQDMMKAIVKLLNPEGGGAKNLEGLAMFPGMEELFSLLKIMEIYESGRYDRIIIDCAPTGETLSLLKFPELMAWYMEKLFPIEKIAMKVLAPISKRAFKIELPDKHAMNDIEKLYVKLVELQGLLKNREISSVRLVTIPEKMVVEETKRNYMYMNLYNFPVDGVCINRILPEDMKEPFFEDWLKIQEQYLGELEEVFEGVPVYRIPWFDTDLNGLDGIDRIAEGVLQKEDLFAVRREIKGEEYQKNDKGYMLKLYLPCVCKEEVDMSMSGTDVIIKIGNFKRNIPIPNTLRSYDITGAKLEGEQLAIQFEESVS